MLHFPFQLGGIAGFAQVTLCHLGQLSGDAASSREILHGGGQFEQQCCYNEYCNATQVGSLTSGLHFTGILLWNHFLLVSGAKITFFFLIQTL